MPVVTFIIENAPIFLTACFCIAGGAGLVISMIFACYQIARGILLWPATDEGDEALSLVDGAYEIVELYKAESPAQKAWKKRWIKRANALGIYGE